MAEVSNFRRLNHRRQEEFESEGEFYLPPSAFVDLDSFCLPNNFVGTFFLDDNAAAPFDLGGEPWSPRSACADPNWISGGEEEEEEEEMNFVIDLYESRETLLPEDPIWEFDDSDRVDGTDLEFGFGSDASAGVGVNPGSAYEDFEVNPSLVNNVDDDDDDDNNGNRVRVCSDFQISENDRDEFEWEEVSERIHFDEREALSFVIDRIDEISIGEETERIHFDDERDTLISAIDQIDEVSISSNITFQGEENTQLGGDDEEEEEEDGTAVEWEVLLAMNDLNRNFEFDNPDDTNINNSQVPLVNTIEYDTLFGQVVDNEVSLRGSPPAAKSVVENLPLVEFVKEELKENGVEVVCAVCKDEVVVEEKVIRLPCTHLYHGECILPWLGIRNTCPVCRYELPTDDAEYERRKTERGSSGGATTELRYNFELLP